MKKTLATISLMLIVSIGFTLFGTHSTTKAAGMDFFDFFESSVFSFQSNEVWQKVERSALTNETAGLPSEFESVRLNKAALETVLAAAPHESSVPLRESEAILSLPMPDGSFKDFRIQEAPVLMPEMAERFPEIKSYRLLGAEDGTMTGRFDLTPQGFHATILGDGGSVTISPADSGNTELYASYTKASLTTDEIKDMCDAVESRLDGQKPIEDGSLTPNVALGPTLRTYRLAAAASWEYANTFGNGTTAGTVASINTWLNGVNTYFEREMSVRLLLVNNTNIIYSTERGFNANNDPFDNDTDKNATLWTQVSTVLRDQVGVENYNLGHVFLANGLNGAAIIGTICQNQETVGAGPLKGAGFTRVTAPAGNPTSLGILVHEFGHQFGANHTHNAAGCAGLTPTNGYETGGGNTIMAYQGNCRTNAYAPPFGADYFHSRSIEQMSDHIINGTGATCAIQTNTGNSAPTITAPAAFNIPKQTPFILTATGNDVDPGDNNNLTYTFEQYQAGGDLYPNPAFSDAGDPVTTTRPILRSFTPSKESSRTFPSLRYILENANVPPDVVILNLPNSFPPTLQRRSGESLPQVARTLPFRITVRDNVGGVNDATTTLTVDGNSGPFRVTAPNTNVTWAGGSMQTVTWDVANTNNAPVSAANVKISLSTDGGQTFPTVLAASVPNNGTANVQIPNGIVSTTARVKIEAVGNIFFDISDANFTITLGGNCPLVNDFNPKLATPGGNVVITGANLTGVTGVRFSNNVNATAFTINNDTQITATVPNGAVSGAITLIKPGCNDLQTGVLTVCTGTPTTLSIDNGQVNAPSGPGGSQTQPRTVYVVNRLTPTTYPATIQSMTALFPGIDNLPQTTVNVVVGAAPSSPAPPSNIPLQTAPITLPADRTTPQTFPVPPITINSGDFIVGYSYLVPANARYFGVNNDESPGQNRSFSSQNGTFFVRSNSAGNFMIRANIFTTCGNGQTACDITIAPGNQDFPGNGGNGTITITANQPNCPWTAIRGTRWINFTSATTGNGNGTLNFTVAANDTTLPRTATIIMAGKTFTINQAAGTGTPACNYTLNPAAANLPGTASAGNTFAVAVANGCAWTAATNDNWINITDGTNGNGNGTVTYSLQANPNAAARTGRITVAGQTFTITQTGTTPVCNFALNPANVDLAAAASAGNNFAVNVGAGCAWTAATNDNWINITNGTGNGNGMVTFSVAANPSTTDARVGTITVGGQAFRVNQAAAVANCNYALNPTSFLTNAGASEGNTFAVATAAGCQWAATANNAWINITDGANGIGNGTVTYSLQANDSQTNARLGTITVAGQTFTIRQPAANQPCLPVNGNLLNWYRGEGNLFDSISANDGVGAGNIAYANDGRIGQAVTFDGMASVAIQRQISDNFTIEFWLRTQATGGANETDWTQGAGLVANDDFGVSLGNGKILFGVGNVTIASANAVNDNQWHHVVATRNRATGNLRLYIDGNVPPVNGVGGMQALNGAAQLIVGKRGANGAFYTGDLDEVKIFDADLDDNQIIAEFNGCAGQQEPRVFINNQAIPEGDPNQNGELENMVFTVSLSAPAPNDIIINYATEEITAQADVDYIPVFGTILIREGQTDATILVPILGDNSEESNKEFEVVLFDATNATISDDEGVGTIIDDDSPCELTLSAPNAIFTSNGGAGNTFTVSGQTGCTWTASTNDSWITVSNGLTNGSGTVTYSVATNPGLARTGNIIVAGQLFRVIQAANPTAATVSVSGRVFTPQGRGLRNAMVTMTDSGGNTRSARTNAFGHYRFANVEAGQVYVFQVTAKKFVFTPQTLTVTEELTDLNFTPQ